MRRKSILCLPWFPCSWFWFGQELWPPTETSDTKSGHIVVNEKFPSVLIWSFACIKIDQTAKYFLFYFMHLSFQHQFILLFLLHCFYAVILKSYKKVEYIRSELVCRYAFLSDIYFYLVCIFFQVQGTRAPVRIQNSHNSNWHVVKYNSVTE